MLLRRPEKFSNVQKQLTRFPYEIHTYQSEREITIKNDEKQEVEERRKIKYA